MGLFSALNASVSGMAAQSNTLTAISQNISNSNTTGYKQVEAEFQDVVSSADQNTFNGAGVATKFRYLNSEQGGYASTNTNTNLAVDGSGFFVVENSAGQQFLTRDGSFAPDSSGNLVNDAGYTLMGYPANYTGPTNNAAALVPVNVNGAATSSNPTTSGTLSVNLYSGAPVSTGSLPSLNTSASTSTYSTTLTTYDDLGAPVKLDVYYTNVSTPSSPDTWQMDVYNHADASSSGGFPYANGGVPDSPLTSQTLTFDPTTGGLSTVTDNTPPGGTTPASAVPIAIPGGQTLNLNISGTTQNAAAFGVATANVNGSASTTATGTVDIAADGTVSAVYADGTEKATFTVALVTVPSPDSLTPLSGNTWQLTSTAGTPNYATPGSTGMGTLKSSTLESSTTDLATQLTNMIQAQSGYQANSKVFQTGTTLLDDLVNLVK